MAGRGMPQFQVTLACARYLLLGSGIEAVLEDSEPAAEPPADGARSTPNDDKAWRCGTCLTAFATARRFDTHLGRHVDRCRRHCHVCRCQVFGTVTDLRRHLSTHTAGQPHACHRCGQAFRSVAGLLEHRNRLHAAVFRHRCTACPRSFRWQNQLLAHSLKHTGQRPHACSVCGKRFASKCALSVHGRIHSGGKPFHCGWPGCSYMARFACGVRVHKDVVHRKVKRFRCSQCSRGFFMPSALKLHVRKMHLEKRALKHRCPHCESTFKSKASLAVHRRSHLTQRDHVCHMCTRAYKSPQALERHVADHMETRGRPHARPFVCDCGKTFKSTGALRRHKRRHQQEHQQQQLQQQQQRQQRESCVGKPPEVEPRDQGRSEGKAPAVRASIWCLECGREFGSAVALEVHYQELHATAGPFLCPDCGCTFAQARLYAHHRAEMHMMYVAKSSPTDREDEAEPCQVDWSAPHMPDVTNAILQRMTDVPDNSQRRGTNNAGNRSARVANVASISVPRTEDVAENGQELDSEDEDGAVSCADDMETESDEPEEPAAGERLRPRRASAARKSSVADDLYKQMLGSSSERAEDTTSSWEPEASDSDRELVGLGL